MSNQAPRTSSKSAPMPGLRPMAIANPTSQTPAPAPLTPCCRIAAIRRQTQRRDVRRGPGKAAEQGLRGGFSPRPRDGEGPSSVHAGRPAARPKQELRNARHAREKDFLDLVDDLDRLGVLALPDVAAVDHARAARLQDVAGLLEELVVVDLRAAREDDERAPGRLDDLAHGLLL